MDEIHVHKTKKSICAHFAETVTIRCRCFLKVIMKSGQKVGNIDVENYQSMCLLNFL